MVAIQCSYPITCRCEHLGASHWEYEELSELVTIPVGDFSGLFAHATVPKDGKRYWAAIALGSSEPEEG